MISASVASTGSGGSGDKQQFTASKYVITGDDHKYIRMAFENKKNLPTPPLLTSFRVYAIITYQENKFVRHVTGTNTECCWMGGSICAERSAITKLREIAWDRILAVYLVSDMSTELTPGLLCREFLCEILEPDTPIIMAAAERPKPGLSTALSYSCKVSSLRALYPHPPLFLKVKGAQLVETAQNLAKRATPITKATSHQAALGLYNACMDFVKSSEQQHSNDHLHPIRYVAGCLLSNGGMRVVSASKLLEFGYSLDPVTKLFPFIEDYKNGGSGAYARTSVTAVTGGSTGSTAAAAAATGSGGSSGSGDISTTTCKSTEPINVALILQVDQFGNLHPPFAPARAHLSEAGFGHIPFLVHNPASGEISQIKISELVNDAPDVSDTLKSIAVAEEQQRQQQAAAQAQASAAAAAAAKTKQQSATTAAAAKK